MEPFPGEVGKYHDDSKYNESGTNTCGVPLLLVPDAGCSFGYRFYQLNRDASHTMCPKCWNMLRPEDFVDDYESKEDRERREQHGHFSSAIAERVAQGQENLDTVLRRLHKLLKMMDEADEWYGRDFYEPMDVVEESIAILKLLKETEVK